MTTRANLSTAAEITIGELGRRAGVAASTIRFYEDQGLIRSARTGGGQRRFQRDALRRIAFIRAAQAVGLSLDAIAQSLRDLPDARTPTRADWVHLSKQWRPMLNERIAATEMLRDKLDSCIGCGCLSLSNCHLYNPADNASRKGSGARYLLGDKPAG